MFRRKFLLIYLGSRSLQIFTFRKIPWDAVGPRSLEKFAYEDAVAVNELSSITFGKNAAGIRELEV